MDHPHSEQNYTQFQQEVQEQKEQEQQFIPSPPLQPMLAPYILNSSSSSFSAPHASNETLFSKRPSYPSTTSSISSITHSASQFGYPGYDMRYSSGLTYPFYSPLPPPPPQVYLNPENHTSSSAVPLPSIQSMLACEQLGKPHLQLPSQPPQPPQPPQPFLNQLHATPLSAQPQSEQYQNSELPVPLPQLQVQVQPQSPSQPPSQPQSQSPSLSPSPTSSPTKYAFGSPTWTPEADAKLVLLKEEYGMGWADIAQHFPTRTPNACQFRWRRLKSRELNRKKKAERKRKVQERLKFQ